MENLKIKLLGRFRVTYQGQSVPGLDVAKVRELFAYLLVHQGHSVSRELLGSLLWGNHCTTAQSKKYLSKALWQLQTALKNVNAKLPSSILTIEKEWLAIEKNSALDIDITRLATTYNKYHRHDVSKISQVDLQEIASTTQQYDGDFLESFFQDWALIQRERYYQMQLALLEKLSNYCKYHELYDAGLFFCQQLLMLDPVREKTHQHLMWFYIRKEDRIRAIRQFEQCKYVLKKELNIEPNTHSQSLLNMAQNNHSMVTIENHNLTEHNFDVLSRIREIQDTLTFLGQKLQLLVEGSGIRQNNEV